MMLAIKGGPEPLRWRSSVSVFVQCENGVVVARQIFAVVIAEPNQPLADNPQIHVSQAAEGAARTDALTDAPISR